MFLWKLTKERLGTFILMSEWKNLCIVYSFYLMKCDDGKMVSFMYHWLWILYMNSHVNNMFHESGTRHMWMNYRLSSCILWKKHANFVLRSCIIVFPATNYEPMRKMIAVVIGFAQNDNDSVKLLGIENWWWKWCH